MRFLFVYVYLSVYISLSFVANERHANTQCVVALGENDAKNSFLCFFDAPCSLPLDVLQYHTVIVCFVYTKLCIRSMDSGERRHKEEGKTCSLLLMLKTRAFLVHGGGDTERHGRQGHCQLRGKMRSVMMMATMRWGGMTTPVLSKTRYYFVFSAIIFGSIASNTQTHTRHHLQGERKKAARLTSSVPLMRQTDASQKNTNDRSWIFN